MSDKMKYVSKKAYGGVPSGAPHEADFGYDLYGTQDDIDQLEDDFGTTDDGSNGHAQGLLTSERIYIFERLGYVYLHAEQ
jgi:hypothetical protein